MSNMESTKDLKNSLHQLLFSLNGLSGTRAEENEQVSKLDADSIAALKKAAETTSEIINAVGELASQDYLSLALNIRIAEKILSDLTYSLNSRAIYRDGKMLRLSEEAGAILIPQLISGLVSCLNNAKMDCFFSGVKFLGKNASEYRNLLSAIDHIEDTEKSLNARAKEAGLILDKMKLVENAMLREGLTRSFKESVDSLSEKIHFFDKVNYGSLAAMFAVTLLLIFFTDNFNTSAVYGRFLLITPLLFLSWFASKRSQFLYQIKEEYSYKHATALAYEGYRDEVEDNPDMKNKLMDVTIGNLGRSPLEQFDKNSDHAPYTQFIREFRKKD